jgi:GT2 family glycosyltransferase
MGAPELSLPVYLIHFNQPRWCASAVKSVSQSRSVRVQLAVVDNGQTEGPPLSAVLPEGVPILTMSENRGYTGGANAALWDWRSRWPGSEFCVIGSHDLHVSSDTFARLLSAAQENPSFGIFAPALVAPFEFGGGVWTGENARAARVSDERGLVERDWVSGACLVLRAACIDQVGGFDERFGSYFEDVDLCLRARDAGWKVGVVMEATAWGLGCGSEEAPLLLEANSVLLAFKRGGMIRGTRALVRLVAWTARCALGVVSFWRPGERRRMSRQFLHRHLSAFYMLSRSLSASSQPERHGVSGRKPSGPHSTALRTKE